MYKGKKILAIVPARYGSKGIPHKNLRAVEKGKPLFMYSVDYAFTSKYIDAVLVSSDSEEILNLAHQAGCVKNGLRPAELASDTARIVDTMLYELQQLPNQYDVIILLQPTYPIRPVNELDKMIEKYFTKEKSLITVVKETGKPEFIRRIIDDKLVKILSDSSDIRRQDMQQYYRIVGSVYINNVHLLNSSVVLNENEIPYVIDEEYAIDIDTEKDWQILMDYIARQSKNIEG